MYLLDANVFIEASRLYYSQRLAPGFWDWLEVQFVHGTVASIPEVRDEILDGVEGHLTQWTRRLPKHVWLEPDEATIRSMQFLTSWTMHSDRPYRDAARNDFLSQADYHLVAAAYAAGHVVVTREQPAPESKRRVLIPDACRALNVTYDNPFTVYQTLDLSLVADEISSPYLF